jgi:uncharacterized protein (DUF952 family)
VSRLFHITTQLEADAARESGEYRPRAFEREGFVHCSYGRQVVATANRIFHGQQGLVLLEIDPSTLGSRVIDENLEGGAERFPHVYGPIPMTAVVRVHLFPCGPDGRFSLPAVDVVTNGSSSA